MDERRKYKRVIIEGMDIHCKIIFASEVKLLTISLGGASISSYRRLNMGSEYTLKIECKDRTILLKGLIVWERLANLEKGDHGESVPIYESGIKFNDVLTGKGAELIDFIDAGFTGKPVKLRLRGTRVRIIGLEKTTIVDYHKSYNVKKISSGGMLIETDHKLKVESKFQIEIIFPEAKIPLKLLGRIASCLEIPDRIPKCYDTGIEFLELNKEAKSNLKEFIDSLEKS